MKIVEQSQALRIVAVGERNVEPAVLVAEVPVVVKAHAVDSHEGVVRA